MPTIVGVNNFTNTAGTRNSLHDYSVIFREFFTSEGVISGLVVTPTSPASATVNITGGSFLIDCNGEEFLYFKVTDTTFTLPITGLGSPKHYLICAKVNISAPSVPAEIVAIEGTAGLDPELTEGGSPAIYYLPIARLTPTGTTIDSVNILQDGTSTTNNSTPEIIYRSAKIKAGVGGNTAFPSLSDIYPDRFLRELTDVSYYYKQYLLDDNKNEEAGSMFYYRAGDPATQYWAGRLETPYRLKNTGQYIDTEYKTIGQVTPAIGGTMKLASNASGATFTWDNGSGGGTPYWYDVRAGDTIYNSSAAGRGENATATVALDWYPLGVGNCTVTNASDIATWLDNDDIYVVNNKKSGKIKIGSGFAVILDPNATNKTVLYSDGTASHRLYFQVAGRSWIIKGKKGPSQGSFDIYVDGVFLANCDTYAVSNSYNQDLYTFVPSSSITSAEEYVRRRHIVEIRPLNDGRIDIEYIWVRNTRYSGNFHSAAPQEYAPLLAPIAVALNDQALFDVAIQATKNLIAMNQLKDRTNDNDNWSDYLELSYRLDALYDGVGLWEQTTYSSNPVYSVYPGQPALTRSGFVGTALLFAYLTGRDFMTASDKLTIGNSILDTCQGLKTGSYSYYVYTVNAALFHALTFIAGYYVRKQQGWTAPTTQLSGAINNSATTITVDSTSDFLRGDLLAIGTEYMAITSVDSSTQLSVKRGIMGTTAQSHLDNSVVTMLDYSYYARNLWHVLQNGNYGTTEGSWFKYTIGDGTDGNNDEGWGDELPTISTITSAIGSSSTSCTVDSLEDLGLDATSLGAGSAPQYPVEIDLQLPKANGTYEVITVKNVIFSSKTIEFEREKEGSTKDNNYPIGTEIRRGHDYVYGRIIPPLTALLYYFAKKQGWSNYAEIGEVAKANYNMSRRRINFDYGTFNSVGGSRLANGGATFAPIAGTLAIFNAMNEGYRGDDYAILWGKWLTDELRFTHFVADAEPNSGNNNANKDLGSSVMFFVSAAPIMIRLIDIFDISLD